MSDTYDPHEIEPRWQRAWETAGLYHTDLDGAARPFYNLMEFPYPSSEGLHVGHSYSYGGADTFGRFQRMRGCDVFQPMGFDAFGIHSENYALRMGTHPAVLVPRNVERFRETQLKRMGAAFDWGREISTSDPSYYRWTQWILVQLLKGGLAYRAEAPVNWCPSCLTTLADEQVVEGRCERCDAPVTQRMLTQWFLRITAYAEQLLDFSGADLPATTQALQRHWIGRREGVDSTGRPAVTYRLRDWLISRQRYWGPPIPVVQCSKCGPVPVPEADLPVLLPRTDDFRPLGTGQSPLAAVPAFVDAACPTCGGPARRETDVSDNFLDSAWYYMRFLCTDCTDRPWDAERLRKWLPVHSYIGGIEHSTMHHLYARFLWKALRDLGHIPHDLGPEPFARLRLHGLIIKDGKRMSKSRGNVVNPDAYIQQYGADVLRMYLLFIGPFEEGGDFRDTGVGGITRFLGRVWRLATNATPRDTAGDNTSLERARHQTIRHVTRDLETLQFNTAISALMGYVNVLQEQAARQRSEAAMHVPGEPARAVWDEAVRTLLLMLAPLAPHLAEELWVRRGGAFSIHQQSWPTWDEALVAEEGTTLVVQINGRVRERLAAPAGISADQARALALGNEVVQRTIGERTVREAVFVPGKLINLVVE